MIEGEHYERSTYTNRMDAKVPLETAFFTEPHLANLTCKWLFSLRRRRIRLAFKV